MEAASPTSCPEQIPPAPVEASTSLKFTCPIFDIEKISKGKRYERCVYIFRDVPLWKSGTESLLLVIIELDKWIGSRAVSDLLEVPAPCLQPPAPKSDDIPIPHDQEVIGRKGMTSPHRFYVLELDSRRLQRLPKDRVAGSVGSWQAEHEPRQERAKGRVGRQGNCHSSMDFLSHPFVMPLGNQSALPGRNRVSWHRREMSWIVSRENLVCQKSCFGKALGLAHNLDSMRAPQCGSPRWAEVGWKNDNRGTAKTERQSSDAMCAYIRPGDLGSDWGCSGMGKKSRCQRLLSGEHGSEVGSLPVAKPARRSGDINPSSWLSVDVKEPV